MNSRRRPQEIALIVVGICVGLVGVLVAPVILFATANIGGALLAGVIETERDATSGMSASEAPGVYTLAPDSRRFLIEEGGYSSVPSSTLTLYPDGRIVGDSIPSRIYTFSDDSSPSSWSGTGTWTKDSFPASLDVTWRSGELSKSSGDYSVEWTALQGKPPFIEVSYGDPDAPERLDFVRTH